MDAGLFSCCFNPNLLIAHFVLTSNHLLTSQYLELNESWVRANLSLPLLALIYDHTEQCCFTSHFFTSTVSLHCRWFTLVGTYEPSLIWSELLLHVPTQSLSWDSIKYKAQRPPCCFHVGSQCIFHVSLRSVHTLNMQMGNPQAFDQYDVCDGTSNGMSSNLCPWPHRAGW